MGQLLVFIVRVDKIVYFFIYLNYGKEAVKLKEYSFEIGSIDDRSETIVFFAVFLYLISLWIKYIQNPIINWINEGDDAKWRKREIARIEEDYRKQQRESKDEED